MIAQRLLEGQTYVTISLVPYIITRSGKAFKKPLTVQIQLIILGALQQKWFRSSIHILVKVMLERLGLEIGKRKRPKGINILALMASILDPRIKGGVGLLNDDKEIIYDKIREAIIEIATISTPTTCCTLWEIPRVTSWRWGYIWWI